MFDSLSFFLLCFQKTTCFIIRLYCRLVYSLLFWHLHCHFVLVSADSYIFPGHLIYSWQQLPYKALDVVIHHWKFATSNAFPAAFPYVLSAFFMTLVKGCWSHLFVFYLFACYTKNTWWISMRFSSDVRLGWICRWLDKFRETCHSRSPSHNQNQLALNALHLNWHQHGSFYAPVFKIPIEQAEDDTCFEISLWCSVQT